MNFDGGRSSEAIPLRGAVSRDDLEAAVAAAADDDDEAAAMLHTTNAPPVSSSSSSQNRRTHRTPPSIAAAAFATTSSSSAPRRRTTAGFPWIAAAFRAFRNPLVLFSLLILSLLAIVVLVLSADSKNSSSPSDRNPNGNTGRSGSGSQKPKPAIPPALLNLYSVSGSNVQDTYTWTTHPNYIDGSYITTVGTNIMIKHVEYDNETVFINTDDINDARGRPISYSTWTISNDYKYLLLVTNYEKGWRHSYFADYWVYDIEGTVASLLTTTKSDKQIPNEIGSGKVSLAVWAPEGHNIAWVRDNDLYVTISSTAAVVGKSDNTGEPRKQRKPDSPKDGGTKRIWTEVRVTTDGSKTTINGISDWVYEEEVLGNNRALWFSPDGTRLAYMKFNETLVHEYHLQYYAKYGQETYPKEIAVKYPKPGTPNPVVTLHVANPAADGSSEASIQVDFGDVGFADSDRLIVELNWVTRNDSFLVRLTNRVQDVQRLFIVSRRVTSDGSVKWVTSLVRNEATPDKSWHTRLQPLKLLPPSPAVGRHDVSYIEIMDIRYARGVGSVDGNNGYAHIAYFASVTDADPTLWITSGPWEVAEILNIDTTRGIVYYTSTEMGSMQRHVYQVNLDGTGKRRLTPPKDTSLFPTMVPTVNQTIGGSIGDVGFYSADFSPLCGYYVLGYMGPDVPFTLVKRTETPDWVKVVQRFDRVRYMLGNYSIPRVMYTTVANARGEDINVRVVYPTEFDPMTVLSSLPRPSAKWPMLPLPSTSSAAKYPVLMEVYGGPNSQTVRQVFSIDFAFQMAVRGMIVVSADGRGTAFRGRKFRSAVTGQLGRYEVDDVITVAKWLRNQTYVDPAHMGIWGWSFGGFLSTKTIEANSGLFTLGMAVAPVSDWRLYDTIYTERYMKTPAQNPDGYATSAITDTSGFRPTNMSFLVAHGTGDDNVHYHNTAMLVWRMTSDLRVSMSRFRMHAFTDSDHSMDANMAHVRIYDLLREFACRSYGLVVCANEAAGAGLYGNGDGFDHDDGDIVRRGGQFGVDRGMRCRLRHGGLRVECISDGDGPWSIVQPVSKQISIG